MAKLKADIEKARLARPLGPSQPKTRLPDPALYYQTLDITPDSRFVNTALETKMNGMIDDAYKQSAKKVHPDVTPGVLAWEVATSRMVQLTDAKNQLIICE